MLKALVSTNNVPLVPDMGEGYGWSTSATFLLPELAVVQSSYNAGVLGSMTTDPLLLLYINEMLTFINTEEVSRPVNNSNWQRYNDGLIPAVTGLVFTLVTLIPEKAKK